MLCIMGRSSFLKHNPFHPKSLRAAEVMLQTGICCLSLVTVPLPSFVQDSRAYPKHTIASPYAAMVFLLELLSPPGVLVCVLFIF